MDSIFVALLSHIYGATMFGILKRDLGVIGQSMIMASENLKTIYALGSQCGTVVSVSDVVRLVVVRKVLLIDPQGRKLLAFCRSIYLS